MRSAASSAGPKSWLPGTLLERAPDLDKFNTQFQVLGMPPTVPKANPIEVRIS